MMREVTPQALLGPLNELELRNAPERLYVEGKRELMKDRPRVSIVGARGASIDGRRRAARLARLLVEEGVSVVSGLAAGIDTAAHKAAIDAGGFTVAVLGTPLDKVYPAANRKLYERIVRDHLAISQFAIGQPIHRSNFVRRNRTMALLVHASVIVEAGNTSGSLSQGMEALRLGRPLFIMKSVCEDSRLTWPAKMITHGANVLSDSIEMLMEMLPFGSDVRRAAI